MIKFSELEVKKQIKIVEGKAELVESKINGEINIKPFTQELIKQVNDEVMQKLNGNETDQEIAYKLFPYLMDIEMDVNYEKFIEIIEQPNEIIALIYETLMNIFEQLINLVKKNTEINEKANKLMEQLPENDLIKIKEEQLNKLYNALNQAKTLEEKNKIFDEISKLKKVEV